MLILDECWMVSLSLRIIKLRIPCTAISCYINFGCQTTWHIAINTRYIQVLNPESRRRELETSSYPSATQDLLSTCRLNWLLFFIFITCAGSRSKRHHQSIVCFTTCKQSISHTTQCNVSINFPRFLISIGLYILTNPT